MFMSVIVCVFYEHLTEVFVIAGVCVCVRDFLCLFESGQEDKRRPKRAGLSSGARRSKVALITCNCLLARVSQHC